MAAGLGFKDFSTGEVLTAADVDGYLMQGVWVFASAAARDAAVTSPQEGNFAYLKDTNVTTYYTGSAWANLDTTGMTNPMTTTGDTIYSSSGSTPARLGIGSTGQVLTVASGVPSWATPAAGGGKVLQVVSTVYSTEFSTTSSTYVDTGLSRSITPSLATSKVLILHTNAVYQTRSPNNTLGISYNLVRDSTQIAEITNITSGENSAVGGVVAFNYLDSPATTSSITYKFQIKRNVGTTTTSYAQNGGSTGSVVLLEIGA